MSNDDEPPTCLRCKQLYTIECGYEAAKHGFCWACCSDIVEKLFELKDDKVFARLLADRAFKYFQVALIAKQKPDEEFEALLIMQWFLKSGTEPKSS